MAHAGHPATAHSGGATGLPAATPGAVGATRNGSHLNGSHLSGPPPNRVARRDCGDFEIRIDRNGLWYYRGSPIGRKELVCLFASVLKREADGSYWLETPVERGRIEVEDAPFMAVEVCWRDCVPPDMAPGKPRQCLTFRTNLDEVVTADADHPIRVHLCPRTREPRPYVTIRPGLEAKINRAVFYELVALAQPEMVDGRELLGVWSEGVFFPIDEASPLDEAANAAAG